mmetsp:Transcript_16041/g.19283  ORF Transcript_16041/g.19283 Transcript_16041/m.19283 type:complete len:465 (-) Transcript_16041:87-1481(-)|eukprot:CAMPEP_0195294698 /NCGR_PEP_ID=MMETSP0707-20130614/15709_1 /TAXON_ID=33640 /ORGANISM="Asterionellopsis glacialis, Strain CCMP134" /LENGTH=464 /DNA_ID=CAMNT_0040355741 /DNA_START=111 /DNA_END=1505 /DNA_ORIENTATION=+
MNLIKFIMTVALVPYGAHGFIRSTFTRTTAASRKQSSSVVLSATVSALPSEEEVVASQSLTVSSTPPSWDELSTSLSEVLPEEEVTPVVTLYRDTNGWCPFCERVWVALRVKNIPYKEQLISLQNKPDWYKELVPSALVPAVLFHGDDDKPERRLVWESLDILKALDEEFPSTPKMVLDTPEYQEATEMLDALNTAGFTYVYANRNASLTEADKEARRMEFFDELDKLDSALGKSNGPFRLGEDFTGLDAIMVPTLERWRYQLPLTAGIDILENRPNIEKWFEGMDSFAPYSERVAGDKYSWTATNSMFLRYFGGGEDKPEVAEAIQRTDMVAEELTKSFSDDPVDDSFAVEAVAKLLSNHDAVVKDCTRDEPLSQKDVPRANDEDAADAVLRYVASIMLSPSPAETVNTAPLLDLSADKVPGASRAARTVAARLCVPRDMGAPAAKIFRKVLSTVADRLDGKE